MLGNIFDAARAAGGVGMGIGGGPMGGDQRSPEQKETRERVLRNIREFKMRPRDVKEYLDRFVVEQDEAKKVLSVALCDHYNWARACINDPKLQKVNYTKPNILILGPTGSGKTYLVRTLAKMLGVPFVKADATKFSETGIVGEDAEDVVRNLVDAADGEVDVAQYGMIYIDEVDKIAGSGRSGTVGAYSGKQVQSNFLKIMEDTEVSVKNPLQASLGGMFGGLGGSQAGSTMSTKFILFIFSGAFNGMNDLIKNRVGHQSIGFLIDDSEQGNTGAEGSPSEPRSRSFLHLAETSDFTEAGLEPEFIGRVPVRVAIEELDANDLYRILTEAEDSILKQYEKEFEGYDLTLKAEEDGLRRVAELAVKEKTGARALVTVLERTLRDFKFELPSTTCQELTLTRALVDDPKAALSDLLSSPELASADIDRWLEKLEQSVDLRLVIEDEVRELFVEECTRTKQAAEPVLNARLRGTGLIAGFVLLREATDGNAKVFTITKAMYDNPKEELEKWKQSLKTK